MSRYFLTIEYLGFLISSAEKCRAHRIGGVAAASADKYVFYSKKSKTLLMNIKSAKVHIVYAPTQEFLVDFLCLRQIISTKSLFNNSVRKVGHKIGVTGAHLLWIELDRT